MAKRSTFMIIIIAVVALGLLFGLNAFTAPMIEANNASSALAPLFEAMPDAKNFEPVFDGTDTVRAVYKETSGLGYAIMLSTDAGYTGDPIEFAMGVDAEGKLTGLAFTAYPETKELAPEYLATYVGQDSAMPDVALVTGATYSSSAVKNAVADGFDYLISNGLVAEGVKGDDQLLMELLPGLFTGMANPEGIVQAEELEASGNIVKALKAPNDSGAAFIVKDGETMYLVCVNVSGAWTAFDVNGEDASAAISSAAADEAVAAAKAAQSYAPDKDMAKLAKLASEGAEFTAIDVPTFNSVVAAYEIADGENSLYGFVAHPYGYSNIPMNFFFIIDGNGAIVSMSAAEFILESDYFSSYTLDESSYKAGFAGQTADSFTEDTALISGATLSSDAARTATEDVFAAFAAITVNGGESNG